MTYNTWATPRWLFEQLSREHGPFDLDAAAERWSACCPRYLVPPLDPDADRAAGIDALALDDWPGRRIWLNPPYGPYLGRFLERAAREAAKGKVVVALVPSRTDTTWWHDVVLRHAHQVRFIRGRLSFVPPPYATLSLRRNRPVFNSAVVEFTRQGPPARRCPVIGDSIDAGRNHKARNVAVGAGG